MRNTSLSLAKILRDGPDPEGVVALRQGLPVSRKVFLHEVQRLTEYLGRQSCSTVGLYCEDSYAFALGFFATLAAEKELLILPHVQTGFLHELRGEFDFFISDCVANVAAPKVHPLNFAASATQNFKAGEAVLLDDTKTLIHLYTSGSSAQPKKISKKLSQLEAEVCELESLWGQELASGVVAATVSHQHIYGLLFKVLWPLAAGRCFCAENVFYPEELGVYATGQRPLILISSPAQLKRMPEVLDFRQFRNSICMIFSSGGSLPRGISEIFERDLGFAPVEVLGSSETGGVAWKQFADSKDQNHWEIFPRVALRIEREDSQVWVRSPFTGSDNWVPLGDRGKISPEGKLEFLGRVDRVAKVEEKRVSLSHMERVLMQHPWVRDAMVIVFPGITDTQRTVIGAAVVLSGEGRNILSKKGRRVLADEFRAHLLKYFEAIVLPRTYRYIDRIPESNSGKRLTNEVQALFVVQHGESPVEGLVTDPEFARVLKGENFVELELRVPANLAHFAGHFPEHAIVPGVIQIDWAMKFAKEYLGIGVNVARMELIKFRDMLLPGATFQLTLKSNPMRNALQFELNDQARQKKYSSGRILFRTEMRNDSESV